MIHKSSIHECVPWMCTMDGYRGWEGCIPQWCSTYKAGLILASRGIQGQDREFMLNQVGIAKRIFFVYGVCFCCFLLLPSFSFPPGQSLPNLESFLQYAIGISISLPFSAKRGREKNLACLGTTTRTPWSPT